VRTLRARRDNQPSISRATVAFTAAADGLTRTRQSADLPAASAADVREMLSLALR
jgi:hypothetical protein